MAETRSTLLYGEIVGKSTPTKEDVIRLDMLVR